MPSLFSNSWYNEKRLTPVASTNSLIEHPLKPFCQNSIIDFSKTLLTLYQNKKAPHRTKFRQERPWRRQPGINHLFFYEERISSEFNSNSTTTPSYLDKRITKRPVSVFQGNNKMLRNKRTRKLLRNDYYKRLFLGSNSSISGLFICHQTTRRTYHQNLMSLFWGLTFTD